MGLPGVSSESVKVVVNGKVHHATATEATLPLLDFLRGVTQTTSVKRGCGEGGCGSCAVVVEETDADGKTTVRSVNSCLTPVFAVSGASVLTAEGLPRNEGHEAPIAERLAGFHASQCGFCTPGMAVACHAALAKAAAAGQTPTVRDMQGALDGNLCRCTGYRPIISACASFAGDVDMEDLGFNTFTAAGKPLPAPARLAACCDGAGAPPAGAEDTPATQAVVLGDGQEVHQPRTLPLLVQTLAELRAAGKRPRLVAGNTGAGVYKNWPWEDTLVSTSKVVEFKAVTLQDGGGVHLGAGVTLAQFIEHLLIWAGQGAAGAGGGKAPGSVPGVWREVAAHLQRVAGSHVRNAATVVGNLVLARQRGLASDVATVLLATGASVTLLNTALPSPTPETLDLATFLVGKSTDDEENALLVTGVTIPTPAAGSVFWSHRIAPRYANAVSTLNLAGLAPPAASRVAPRLVVGFDLEPSTSTEQWRVGYLRAVEGALGADLTAPLPELVTAALAALPADLEALGLPATGKDAESTAHYTYLRSTAEGLVAQAVTALYGGAGEPDPSSVLDPDGQLSRDLSKLSATPSSVGSDGGASSPTHGPTSAHSLPPRLRVRGDGLPSKLPPPRPNQGKQVIPEPDPELAPLTQALPKDSAVRQAQGLAQYTDDVPIAKDALYGAWVTSMVAKGRVVRVDTTKALAVPGVARFVGWDDVPVKDEFPLSEPVFARDVEYHGQGIGLILANSYAAASRGAALVEVTYDAPDHPAILTTAAALAAGSVYPLELVLPQLPAGPNHSVCLGAANVGDALSAAPHVVRGLRVKAPSQAHFYLEPHATVAQVDEDGCLVVHAASQQSDDALAYVAHHLALQHSQVEVRNRRLGGAFGGKINPASHQAGAAAVAAKVTGKQVRLASTRNADLGMVGGRCEAEVDVDVGYDSEGRILALDVRIVMAAGAYLGNSMFDVYCASRTVDSVYLIPAVRASFTLARLNLPPRNSVRAPGDVASLLTIESVVDTVATALGLDPTLVRERNMRPTPPPGQSVLNSFGEPQGAGEQYSLPCIWKELKASAGYEGRVKDVEAFNAASPWVKRGLALVPCLFPIMALSKSAFVHVYQDGSVRVGYPGTEVGQGLAVKTLQTAAYELSKVLPPSQRPLPLSLFRPADHTSYALPHNSMTGGSTTTDAAVFAVRAACEDLVTRMRPYAEQLGEGATWQGLIQALFPVPFLPPLTQLSTITQGSAANDLTKGMVSAPFHAYTTYGAALAEVEVDVLTGDRRVLAVDLLFDCGKSLNPGVDLGQLEGAFMMGLGVMLNEHMESDPLTGASTTNSTWRYKVPSAWCVPERFNVALLKDSPLCHKGPLSAKGVGEPALLLGTSVLCALRAATRAAASQTYGLPALQAPLLQAPALPTAIKLACGTEPLAKHLHAARQHAGTQ